MGLKESLLKRYEKKAEPEDIDRIDRKLPKMNRGQVKEIWDKVQALYCMIKDPNVPWSAKILPVAGLIYLISPADAIPDPIPVLGYSDDVAIILGIIAILADQLNKYVKIPIDNSTNTIVNVYNKLRVFLVIIISLLIVDIIIRIIFK